MHNRLALIQDFECLFFLRFEADLYKLRTQQRKKTWQFAEHRPYLGVDGSHGWVWTELPIGDCKHLPPTVRWSGVMTGKKTQQKQTF